jgi:hypothetical protein
MRYRVEITEEPRHNVMIEELPKAKMGAQVNYSLFNKLAAIGGADMRMSEPDRQATKTITKVPREAANLEAEGGETVLTFDPAGYPLFYTIKGPRHHSGGVPLNLPDDSFIFSDTKEMIIRECTILKMFNKPCNKKGYTPADLSKQFDINNYRNILQDPNTDEITRKTAESMIKKYVIKLGALALAQESKKGFPQGIPVVAQAYMDANGISEDDIMPQEPSPMQQGQGQMSPIDQMPPDQYAQEQMPDGMQNASPDQMDEQQMQQMMMAQQQQGQAPQQGGIPEGAATPEMMQGMMQQMDQQQPMGRYGMAMNSPMAMYGMEMGGFYPEYAFGGISRFDGGGNTRPANTTKVGNQEYDANKTYEVRKDAQGEYKYTKEKGNVEGRVEYDKEHAPGGGGPFKGSLCRDMKTKGTKAYGKTADEVVKYAFGHHYNADGSVNPKWAKINAAEIAKLTGCEVQGAREIEKAIYTEKSPDTKCPDCIDPITGQAVTTGPDGKPFTRTKDANGNCTPCPTKECFCKDENGNEITVDCNDPCLQEQEQGAYYGESNQGQEVPFKSDPNNIVWADANMNPEYIGSRGVQLEQYGIDPRAQANAAGAVTNKIIENQSQFAANPGATLANQLMAQSAGAPAIDAAFDQANKFNTQVRNQEIATNTAYRKDYLDKLPVYAQSYLGDVARKKENDARFFNEKQAKKYEMKQAKNKYDTEMNWLQASNENIKWGGPDRGFYSVKTKDFTPTAGNTDTAQRMKDLMNTYGIEDENVAYKLATAARYGGQYAEGGFVYSDSIFPYLL